jgi:hypothetical protein
MQECFPELPEGLKEDFIRVDFYRSKKTFHYCIENFIIFAALTGD